jgi:drug/metabolite transporter (DMT)-like permease
MSNRDQTQSLSRIPEEPIEGNAATPSQPSTGSRPAIFFSLLAVFLIWGSTYLGIRLTLASFPPFMMSGIRFVIAGSLLFLFLRGRGMAAPTRAQWIGSALVGALLLVGGYGGVGFAEQWVSSGLAAVGAAASPLWTALFIGLMGRWPTRREWLGLGLGFVGVILLNLEHGVWANAQGAVALILAPICWALGSAISSRVALPTGLMSSAAQMLIGGGMLLILSVLLGERVKSTPTLSSLLALIYLIVFGSLVAFSAYGYLLRHVRPALATSYAYVNPIIAICLGVLLASERITPVGVVAMIVILASVGLVSGEHSKRKGKA